MIGRVEAVATPPSQSEAWSSHDLIRAVSKALAALDPFRLAGAVLFIALWELASLLVSPIILPGPLSVLGRAATDFWSAPALSYYGVEDPSLAGNLAYTAENVAIAALIGAVIGVTLGLLSARVWFVRAAMDPIMMTAGTVPILIAAPFLLDLVRRRAGERGQPGRVLHCRHPLRLRPARGAAISIRSMRTTRSRSAAVAGGCCATS